MGSEMCIRDSSESFIRTWDYYFSYCEAAFLERAVQVFQLEWIKPTEP